MKKTTLLLISTAACTITQAQNAFDTDADLTNNFTQITNSGSVWGHSDTGGNSGGYVTTTGNNGFNTTVQAFTFDTDADQSFTISGDFLTVGGQSTTSRRSLQFGISTSASNSYRGSGFLNETSISSGLFTESHAADTTNFRYYSGTNNPDATDAVSVGSNNDLAHDRWFHLETTWTYTTATDTFDITLLVKDATQTNAISNTVNIGTAITNPFGDNPTLYAFFGGRDSFDSGVSGFDNFSTTLTPVPEPSAYALIAGTLALGWIMVRRRR